MNAPKFIQIVANRYWVFGLAEDGSVWKKSTTAGPDGPWDRMS